MPEKVLIHPSRSKGDPLIDRPVLFFVNPGETKIVLQEAKNLRAVKHFLFHSNLFELPAKDKIYWAGPAIGAPMAVMTMEKLIALGANKILLYGWCGSLSENMKIGDIFLPLQSISEEGTSAHYPLQKQAEPSTYLVKKIRACLERDYTVHEGSIWTTDAPYRETLSKIKNYRDSGIMAVDMEFSALCTVAAYRVIDFAAVMLVSDEINDNTWRPGFQKKSFRQSSRNIFLTLTSLLQKNTV